MYTCEFLLNFRSPAGIIQGSPVPEKQGKTLHIWEQPESGIRSIIEKFAKTGQVICDPMAGSSSVGVIALEMDCFYIGIDKDQTCIDISRSRLIDKVCIKKEKIA